MFKLGTTLRRTALAALVTLTMIAGLATFGAVTTSATSSTSDRADRAATVAKSAAGKMTSEVRGRTSAGDRVTGKFTPIRTVRRHGTLNVKGFLQGVITDDDGRKTRFSGIETIPIKKVNGTRITDARSLAGTAQCEILNLVLGPLDLNLLGLEIHLSQVVLDIIARPGPGQLLGNLLCAVAGLLDGGPLAGLLGQLRTLLNQILGLLNLGV